MFSSNYNEEIEQQQQQQQSQSQSQQAPGSSHIPDYYEAYSTRYEQAVNSLTTRRPNASYAELITMAIESSPEQMLTLKEIYNWISSNFPFFSTKKMGWQNSIRHNLSLNRCFYKVPRAEGARGKGSYWKINYDYQNARTGYRVKKYGGYPPIHISPSQSLNGSPLDGMQSPPPPPSYEYSQMLNDSKIMNNNIGVTDIPYKQTSASVFDGNLRHTTNASIPPSSHIPQQYNGGHPSQQFGIVNQYSHHHSHPGVSGLCPGDLEEGCIPTTFASIQTHGSIHPQSQTHLYRGNPPPQPGMHSAPSSNPTNNVYIPSSTNNSSSIQNNNNTIQFGSAQVQPASSFLHKDNNNNNNTSKGDCSEEHPEISSSRGINHSVIEGANGGEEEDGDDEATKNDFNRIFSLK